jgi:hypothetical protein
LALVLLVVLLVVVALLGVRIRIASECIDQWKEREG